MRNSFVLAIVLGGVATTCTYDAPNAGVGFKCDEDHGCPVGQLCVAGTCDGSGGSGSGSSTADGVKCAADGVCGVGEQCCASPLGVRCAPLGTPCDAGTGGQIATCDGVEDCAGSCCGATNAACGEVGCSPAVCTTTEDCGNNGTTCCFDISYVPWGHCSFC